MLQQVFHYPDLACRQIGKIGMGYSQLTINITLAGYPKLIYQNIL
jgi:hypothetical protein